MSHARSLKERVLAGFLIVSTAAGGAALPANDAQAGEVAALQTPSDSVRTREVRVLTDKEAWSESDGRIVLHYGEGIRRADVLADVLSQHGRPAIAYPGGSPGAVELFINKKPPLGSYSQRDVDDGSLGGVASDLYDKYVSVPVPSLDQQ